MAPRRSAPQYVLSGRFALLLYASRAALLLWRSRAKGPRRCSPFALLCRTFTTVQLCRVFATEQSNFKGSRRRDRSRWEAAVEGCRSPGLAKIDRVRVVAVFHVVRLGCREHTVDEALGVVPRDVLRRIWIERGLVRPDTADVEQLPKVLAQEVPGEVVRCFAFVAIDDKAAHAAWLEQRLEHFEVLEINEDVLAVLGRQRFAGGLVHLLTLAVRSCETRWASYDGVS
jgi:hypothetical protein